MARITKTIFLTAAEAAVYKSTGTCQHVTPNGDTITVSDTDTDCIVYCPEDEPATKAELAEAVKHHYSTTEQVVGTWIDGKPLYEKTVQFNVTGGGDQKYNINNILENHETILTYNIVGLDNDDKYVTTYYASSTSYLGTWINSTREFVVTTGINPPKPITLYVTFRYTKTTDTAPSA